ncbi:MAG: hypothetical protein P4L49_05240 [Desulfosporosinus sp.]|nr:hypothetical protein [Desulfosporosinus sp.]
MYDQQLYTRSNHGGLVLNTPGFDTVAKTEGLTLKELKELENYCKYEVDGNLINTEDYNLCPKVRSMLELPNGNVLIGQSVFRMENRAVFLTHNFICQKGSLSWENMRHNYRELTSPQEFIETFADNGNKINLEQLHSISASAKNAPFGSSASTGRNQAKLMMMALEKYHINSEALFKLINVLFFALENGRKLFVSLPCGTQEINAAAEIILQGIYALLPYDVRTKAGYMTCFTGKGVKNAIVLYFVPKEIIPASKRVVKIKDRNISNDFIFNFNDSIFINTDSDQIPPEDAYLRLLKSVGFGSESLREYFDFCEKVLYCTNEKFKTKIGTYDNLSRIFNYLANGTFELDIQKCTKFMMDIIAFDEDYKYTRNVLLDFLVKYNDTLKRGKSPASSSLIRDLIKYALKSKFHYQVCLNLIGTSIELCSENDLDLLIEQIQLAKSCQPIYEDLAQIYFFENDAIFDVLLNYIFAENSTFSAMVKSVEQISNTFKEVELSPLYSQAIQKHSDRVLKQCTNPLGEIYSLGSTMKMVQSNNKKVITDFYYSAVNLLFEAIDELHITIGDLTAFKTLSPLFCYLSQNNQSKAKLLLEISMIVFDPQYFSITVGQEMDNIFMADVKKTLKYILSDPYFKGNNTVFEALKFTYTSNKKNDYRELCDHFKVDEQLFPQFMVWLVKGYRTATSKSKVKNKRGNIQLSLNQKRELYDFFKAVVSFYRKNWTLLENDKIFKALKEAKQAVPEITHLGVDIKGDLLEIKIEHLPLLKKIAAKATKPLARMLK